MNIRKPSRFFFILLYGTLTRAWIILPNNHLDYNVTECHYDNSTFDLKCSASQPNALAEVPDFQLVKSITLENCQSNTIGLVDRFEQVSHNWIDRNRLTELRILNCHLFDKLKSVIFSQSLEQLTSFTYTLDCSDRKCEGFCDYSLNNSFLHSLAKVAPNLKQITLKNVGLCSRVTENTGATLSPNLNFSMFRFLQHLDLTGNSLEQFPLIPTSVVSLNITHNHILQYNISLDSRFALKTLDISANGLKILNLPNIHSLSILNVSRNDLVDIDLDQTSNSSSNIQILDISDNRLQYLDGNLTGWLPKLKHLRLSGNPITGLSPFAQSQTLESIDVSSTQLETLNFDVFGQLFNLRRLNVGNSPKLRFMYGQSIKNLTLLEQLFLANCSFRNLPYDIFHRRSRQISVDIKHNPWPCDCRLNWLAGLDSTEIYLLDSNQTYCAIEHNQSIAMLITNYLKTLNETSCDFGTTAKNGVIIRGTYGMDTLLDCAIYSTSPAHINWYKMSSEKVFDEVASTEKHVLYADGTLRIRDVRKSDVAVYACVASNNKSDQNLTIFQRLRIDYTAPWWLLKIYSIACGMLLAMVFFALNAISGALRRLIAWRVTNIERKGRVRLLLESMEKYRARQMVCLHDMYNCNVSQIRENYHQQVEALRKSYATQVGRFRDYRNVQMENVANHLDALRDNYNSQMSRIRDYGAKRTESVWLSYHRRVSCLRDYTIQHRTRLMNRYKLKQCYFNKLLENLGANWSTTARPSPPPELIELQSLVDLASPGISGTGLSKVTVTIPLKQRSRFRSMDLTEYQESGLDVKRLVRRRLSIDFTCCDHNNGFLDEALKYRQYCHSEPTIAQ